MKKNNGVTLIALVITIIVLLILAGVTISFVVGDNGVLTKATKVEVEYSKAEIEENVGSFINDQILAAYAKREEEDIEDITTLFNEDSVIQALIDNEYVTADTNAEQVNSSTEGEGKVYSRYYINAYNISTGNVTDYGKGTSIDDGDVFTLEVILNEDGTASTGKYKIMYYNDDGEAEELSTVTFILNK